MLQPIIGSNSKSFTAQLQQHHKRDIKCYNKYDNY